MKTLRALSVCVAWVVIGTTPLTLFGCGQMDLLLVIRGLVDGTGVIVYVSPDGTSDGSNSGLVPGEPVDDIAYGMHIAERYGGGEVRVAEGTYYPGEMEFGALISFRASIALRGGYSSDFSTRDPQTHVTTIFADDTTKYVIQAYDPAVDSALLEGFHFEVPITVADGHWGVISMSATSLSVVDNVFRVHLSGLYDDAYTVIRQWKLDHAAVYDVVIHGNDIVATSETTFNRDVCAISLGEQEPGSNVTISANRVSVQGDGCATGIQVVGAHEVGIWNNVISVIGGDGAEGILTQGEGMASGNISLNTIISSDVGGNAKGIVFGGYGSVSAVEVTHNIIGSPDGTGVAVDNQASGTLDYNDNLSFNFFAQTQGSVNVNPNNDHVAADIFSDVFSSAYDATFSDGDSADYHLDDTTGGPYAVDQGNAGSAPYDINIDFEGDTRPQGTNVDRGADEKVQ